MTATDRHVAPSGGGHYPPPGGGHKYESPQAMFDLLGPIFGAQWHEAAAHAWAESSGDTHARNVNSDGKNSVDRGLFQLNSYWHPEVPDAVAYNAHGAAIATYKITKGGKDWHEWNAPVGGINTKAPNGDDAGLFGIGRGPGADTVASNAAHSVSSVGKFLGKLSVIFSGGFWLRIGLVVMGLALLAFGITTIGKQYAIGTTIGKVFAGGKK